MMTDEQDTLFGGTTRTDAVLKRLWQIPGWPSDELKDRQLVNQLIREFPDLDLADQLGRFELWLATRGTGKEVKSRGRWQRIRNWCSNARRFRAEPGRGSSGSQGPRHGGAAQRPDEFGDSGLGSW